MDSDALGGRARFDGWSNLWSSTGSHDSEGGDGEGFPKAAATGIRTFQQLLHELEMVHEHELMAARALALKAAEVGQAEAGGGMSSSHLQEAEALHIAPSINQVARERKPSENLRENDLGFEAFQKTLFEQVDTKTKAPWWEALQQTVSNRSKMSKATDVTQQSFDELALVRGWASNFRKMPRELEGEYGCKQTGPKLLQAVVGHPAFDITSGCLIIANALVSGFTQDYMARHRTLDPPWFLDMAGMICLGGFLLELFMRFVASGPFYFFCAGHLWNYFDFIVVGADVVIELIRVFTRSVASGAGHVELMRVLRVVRIARAMRVLRLLRVFKALRLMVLSILRSGAVLLWSMVMLFVVVYVFATYFLAVVTEHLSNNENSTRDFDVFLTEHFGSLPQSINILFMSISGGVDWSIVADSLAHVTETNRLVMVFFVFFTMFALMNIITGIFVEFAVSSAHNDKDEVIAEEISLQTHSTKELLRLFKLADCNDDGTISSAEFLKVMERPEVRAIFARMDVEVSKAFGIFKLLDKESKDALTPEEFVTGVIRLKGNAKTIDLVTLMHENKKIIKMIKCTTDAMDDCLQRVLHNEAVFSTGMGQLIDMVSVRLSGVPAAKIPREKTQEVPTSVTAIAQPCRVRNVVRGLQLSL